MQSPARLQRTPQETAGERGHPITTAFLKVPLGDHGLVRPSVLGCKGPPQKKKTADYLNLSGARLRLKSAQTNLSELIRRLPIFHFSFFRGSSQSGLLWYFRADQSMGDHGRLRASTLFESFNKVCNLVKTQKPRNLRQLPSVPIFSTKLYRLTKINLETLQTN